MTVIEAQQVKHGLYAISWVGGGMSFGAVGSNWQGLRWFAPTNWVNVPSYDWGIIESVIPIKEGKNYGD